MVIKNYPRFEQLHSLNSKITFELEVESEFHDSLLMNRRVVRLATRFLSYQNQLFETTFPVRFCALFHEEQLLKLLLCSTFFSRKKGPNNIIFCFYIGYFCIW